MTHCQQKKRNKYWLSTIYNIEIITHTGDKTV